MLHSLEELVMWLVTPESTIHDNANDLSEVCKPQEIKIIPECARRLVPLGFLSCLSQVGRCSISILKSQVCVSFSSWAIYACP